LAGPVVAGFSGTHPVNSTGAAASTSVATLAIFDPLDKPMQKRPATRRRELPNERPVLPASGNILQLDCIARGTPV
jgi:hypothetical protein